MNRISRENIFILSGFIYMVLISLFCVSQEQSGFAVTIFLLLCVFLFAVWLWKNSEKLTTGTVSGIMVLSILLMLLWNLYLYYKGMIWNDKYAMIAQIFGIFTVNFFAVSAAASLIQNLADKKLKFGNIIKNNLGLFVIFVVFIIGSVPAINAWMTNDGTIYYMGVMNARENWNFYNISALNLGSHGGYAYCLFTLLGDLFVYSSTKGIVVINIFMALVTILCFYKFLEKLCKNINRTEQTILTMLFAFSPLLYGMIGDINLEFPQLCFLMWLICAHAYKNTPLKVLSGILLCFTKETSVLIYAGYCLGEFIYYFLKQHDKKIVQRFVRILTREMKYEFCTGCFWLFIYKVMNTATWTETVTKNSNITENNDVVNLNSFTIWYKFILYKLKELFVFNGNWILWLLGIILILLHAKKIIRNIKLLNKDITWAVFFSGAVFMITQLCYVTWTNYRYLAPFAVYQAIILSVIFYYGLKKTIVKRVLLGILTVSVFCSNYYTIDFVTRALYIERNLGNGNILIPNLFSVECLTESGEISRVIDEKNDKYTSTRDCLFYNRQSAYVGNIMRQIFEDIDYQDNILIIVPNIFYDAETTSQNIFYRDLYVLEQLYWDKERNDFNGNIYRDTYKNYDSSRYEKVNIVIWNDLKNINTETGNYEKIYVLYPHYNQDYDIDNFLGSKYKHSASAYNKNIMRFELFDITQ